MNKQNWNAEKYQTEAAYVAQLGSPVVELLNPQVAEKILDLGCGDGTLTKQIADLGCQIVGVDSSPEMITLAEQKGLQAKVLAAEAVNHNQEFDAIFSNAVLHWVSDIELATSNVYRALKPGGRFVGEFGGQGNIQTLTSAISDVFSEHPQWGEFHNPWYFPSISQFSKVLDEAGFTVMYVELIPRPTPLKSGVDSWLAIFAEGITRNLDSTQKQLFRELVTSKLKPVLYSETNGWVADYVRIRFKAIKKA